MFKPARWIVRVMEERSGGYKNSYYFRNSMRNSRGHWNYLETLSPEYKVKLLTYQDALPHW